MPSSPNQTFHFGLGHRMQEEAAVAGHLQEACQWQAVLDHWIFVGSE